MRLSDPYITMPADGWSFKDPDTGVDVAAQNPFTLLRKINEHRTYKNLNLFTVEDLERYLTAKIAQSVAGETGVG